MASAHARSQLPFYRADQVVHVVVAMQATELGDVHATFLTELPKIIAQQVGDHHVFCAIFLGVQKRLCQRCVLLGVDMPGRRAFDGLRRDRAVMNPQEALWRK